MYNIKASNQYGDAQANVKVTVIDRPSEPEGPLEYPTTSKHTVTLQWKPPKDDGGTEIVGYQVSLFYFLHNLKLPEIILCIVGGRASDL